MHPLFEIYIGLSVNQPQHIIGNSKICIDLLSIDQPTLITSNEIHPSLHDTCHHQVTALKQLLNKTGHSAHKKLLNKTRHSAYTL